MLDKYTVEFCLDGGTHKTSKSVLNRAFCYTVWTWASAGGETGICPPGNWD